MTRTIGMVATLLFCAGTLAATAGEDIDVRRPLRELILIELRDLCTRDAEGSF